MTKHIQMCVCVKKLNKSVYAFINIAKCIDSCNHALQITKLVGLKLNTKVL